MSKKGIHLFFIYEPEQVPVILARIAGKEKVKIVALDYEVELELKKRGINFTSLSDISVSPDGDRDLLEYTRTLALNWYTSKETAFLEHDGILLGEQHEVVVLYYLQTLVYYISVLEQVLSHFPNVIKISVPMSFHYVSDLADPTAIYKERLPLDVLRLLANRRGITLEVISPPITHNARDKWFNFKTKLSQFMFGRVVRVSNALVNFFTKQRPIKIFVSDPWSRLESFIKKMDDVELVMTRRKELKVMKWDVFKTRARFHHRLDFVDEEIRKVARSSAQEIAKKWDALGNDPSVSKPFKYKEISFWPIAKEMLDSLVKNHTEDAIATIENTKKLFKYYGVNCVLLFASTKGYNNVIARVAKRMDIPSIELQHALTNNQKTLVHCRLNSRYLAAYGALTRKMYESWGVEPWRIIECGSPRFDSYFSPLGKDELETIRLKLHLDNKFVNVLVNVPQIYLSLEYGNYTSYEVEQTLKVYAELQKEIQGVRLMLRPRPGPWRQNFYRREETLGLFNGETRYVQSEDLRVLLALSDVVISGGSTMILEALILRKPVIAYLPKKLDHDFQAFEDAGAILVARTKEELFKHASHLKVLENREMLVRRADDFLRENFILDGKSPERVREMIRKMAKVDQL